MKHEILNSKQFQNYKFKYSKSRFQFLSFDIRICFEFRIYQKKQTIVFVIYYQVILFGCGSAVL